MVDSFTRESPQVRQVFLSEITDEQQTSKDMFMGLILDQASRAITTLENCKKCTIAEAKETSKLAISKTKMRTKN